SSSTTTRTSRCCRTRSPTTFPGATGVASRRPRGTATRLSTVKSPSRTGSAPKQPPEGCCATARGEPMTSTEPLPITLTVRKVDIDFSQAKIDWCPNEPEYAQLLNGLSSGFPLLEPFLIKVVRQAKEKAPEHMQKKLELFIAQEGRHYKQHAKWNHKLDEAGYELQPVLDRLAKSYEKA